MTALLTVQLRHEHDIVAARRRARELAHILGYDTQEQTRIATAVSEIARNAFNYAGGGKVEFTLEGEHRLASFVAVIADTGPGIEKLDEVLSGAYRSTTGMGLGIVGARRLMDEVKIDSARGRGTSVRLVKRLPAGDPPDTATVAKAVELVAREKRHDAMEELQLQNRELLRVLAQLQERQEELKRLNQELEDTNRGVVALYAELDARADDLKRAAEQKSRFLSNVSHELRTPLQSTLGLTRLLLDRTDGDLSGEQEKQVAFIRDNVGGLLEMVGDLLDLAKIEAGKIEVRTAEVRVENLFSALRGTMRVLPVSEGVQLVFEQSDELPTLLTDEAKLSQILRNFVSNALKFTERGSVVVRAELDAAGDCMMFSVADSGVGIPDQDHSRIFEEFVQLPNPLQQRHRGTGLGLPLARRLAEAIGGRVEMTSVVGEGSVFRALVPLSRRLSPAAAREGDTADAGVSADAQERALIIDDDELARQTLRRLLLAQSCIVYEVSNGAAGVADAITLRPDVIFLDLGMPDMSGEEVLARLRLDPRTRSIPVVIVTDRALAAIQRSASCAEADSILGKADLSATTIARILKQVQRNEESLRDP